MQKNNTSLSFLTGLTFVVSFIIFSGIFLLNIQTDLQGHIYGLTVTLQHHSFPVPPLYYFGIYLFAGCTLNIPALFLSSTILLALAVSLKYYYAAKYINKQNNSNPLIINVVIWLFLFSAPIVYNYRQIIVGRIPMNVWHNSTTIFLMPFAFLLYQKTFLIIKQNQISKKEIWSIIGLGVLNLLIKPSFLFPLIPAFLFMTALNTGFKSSVFKIVLSICVVLGLLICLEYYCIYKLDVIDAVRFKNDTKGIEIKPFYSMLLLSNKSVIILVLNIISSIAFPVAFVVLYPNEFLKQIELKFVGLIFLFSMLIGVLLNEKGAMAGFGNFLWQIYIANYLLFYVLIKNLHEKINKEGLTKKSRALIFIFGLHVFSGFLYLLKTFYLKSYL